MKRCVRKAAGVLALSALMLTGYVRLGFAEDVPRLLNYQGRLADNVSKAPRNGKFTMTFRIFTAEDAGSQLPLPPAEAWEEVHTDVDVKDGFFSVLLGGSKTSPKPLPNGIFDALPTETSEPARYLEVRVKEGDNPEEKLSPRQRIVSAPYAMAAADIGARVALKTGKTGIQWNVRTILSWPVERWDEGNVHAIDTPSAAQNLVAPQRGKYMIFATIAWDNTPDNAAHTASVELLLNNNRTMAAQTYFGPYATEISVSTIAALELGDQVSCRVFHSNSAGISVYGSDSTTNPSSSEFGMMKIP